MTWQPNNSPKVTALRQHPDRVLIEKEMDSLSDRDLIIAWSQISFDIEENNDLQNKWNERMGFIRGIFEDLYYIKHKEDLLTKISRLKLERMSLESKFITRGISVPDVISIHDLTSSQARNFVKRRTQR